MNGFSSEYWPAVEWPGCPIRPIQLRIEGPPFYADAQLHGPAKLTACNRWICSRYQFFPEAYPLVPGTRYGIAQRTLYDISPTDHYWMLLRGQLAADFLVASSLKLRVAGGFNYPGMQAIGIDGIYLFRTGRVGTTAAQPTPARGTGTRRSNRRPAAGDRPRRSYWGVLGGFTPKWWTPETWGPLFEPDDPDIVEGREFRIGITRGRPLGYEFGVSFVRKSLTEILFQPCGLFSGRRRYGQRARIGIRLRSDHVESTRNRLRAWRRIPFVHSDGQDRHSA